MPKNDFSTSKASGGSSAQNESNMLVEGTRKTPVVKSTISYLH